MIKAIFFDLDGTLCNPGSSWEMGISASFTLFESRFPGRRSELETSWRETNTILLGELAAGRMPMREVISDRFPRTLSAIGIQDRTFGDELNDCLSATRKDALRPMVGAHDTLRTLRTGYYLGVITNGSDANYADSQMATIEQIRVQDLVDSIWISDAVGHRKPDARIFLAALAGADVNANESIYVGDSVPHDVAGANAAGMSSILIDPSGTFDQSDGDIRPNHVIRSLSDVIPILKEIE
jgi:HAD superfamily hydrolase (TIGR01549 family)